MNQEQQGIEFGSATGDDQHNGPVTCLGIAFESDEARRAYFTEKLREKLKDPEFRKIEGFPIGEDEDINAGGNRHRRQERMGSFCQIGYAVGGT